jgi:hypothetical protein
MFERVAHGFASVLKMYGFQVIDTIQMTGGNDPSAVKERHDLLDKAENAGKQL